MKFFTNKSVVTKIVIALVIVLVFQFIVTKPSLGADSTDTLEFGGKLLSPFVSLGVTLADAMVDIMHSAIMGTGETLLKVETTSGWWNTIVKWVLMAAIAVALFMTGNLVIAIIGVAISYLTGTGELVMKMANGIITRTSERNSKLRNWI